MSYYDQSEIRSLFLTSNKENKHSLHVGALRNTNVRKRATKFCIDSNYVSKSIHITMPHIDITSVILNILTTKSSTYIFYCQVTSSEPCCINIPHILKHIPVCYLQHWRLD